MSLIGRLAVVAALGLVPVNVHAQGGTASSDDESGFGSTSLDENSDAISRGRPMDRPAGGVGHSGAVVARADDPHLGALSAEHQRFERDNDARQERGGRTPVLGVYSQNVSTLVLIDRKEFLTDDDGNRRPEVGKPPPAVTTYQIDDQTLELMQETRDFQRHMAERPSARGMRLMRTANQEMLDRGYSLFPTSQELAALMTLNYLQEQGKGAQDMGDNWKIIEEYLAANARHTYGVMLQIAEREAQARATVRLHEEARTERFGSKDDPDDPDARIYEVVDGDDNFLLPEQVAYDRRSDLEDEIPEYIADFDKDDRPEAEEGGRDEER